MALVKFCMQTCTICVGHGLGLNVYRRDHWGENVYCVYTVDGVCLLAAAICCY